MARRKRQLRLLEHNPLETRPLFTDAQFPYDTPDEIAYNAKRKKDGLFEITPAEEDSWKQAQKNGSVGKKNGSA